MSLIRAALCRSSFRSCLSRNVLPTTSQLSSLQFRRYAKRSSNSTQNLVPLSERPIVSATGAVEYQKAKEKMTAAVDWFRREMAQVVQRASGRITPALLDSVRVGLKDEDGLEHKARLEEIATVGVRDNSVLIITAFDSHNLKAIEAALYDAKLPGITPQRADERTIRIPVPKPTIEARQAQYTAATRTAEDTRIQLRRHHTASIKKCGYSSRSHEYEVFKKMLDGYIADVDAILGALKKGTGAR